MQLYRQRHLVSGSLWGGRKEVAQGLTILNYLTSCALFDRLRVVSVPITCDVKKHIGL